MSEIPQAAIDAARAALADLPVGTSLWGYELTNAARRALEAAAPLIAAAVQAEHGPVAYGLGLADGALAERERCAQLAEQCGAIYPLQPPAPAVTVNGDPVPTTAGNVVAWPDGMPAIGLVGCLLRNQPEGIPDGT